MTRIVQKAGPLQEDKVQDIKKKRIKWYETKHWIKNENAWGQHGIFLVVFNLYNESIPKRGEFTKNESLVIDIKVSSVS